ncbi:MAG: hypothetical protein ACXWAB_12765, partial [Methylobacter sp.]
LAMTRRDVGKPAFSLRKKRFVKTHALSLLRTKNLRYAMLRFQDFQRRHVPAAIQTINISSKRFYRKFCQSHDNRQFYSMFKFF